MYTLNHSTGVPDFLEFEASWVYRVRSSTQPWLQKNPILKSKTNKQKNRYYDLRLNQSNSSQPVGYDHWKTCVSDGLRYWDTSVAKLPLWSSSENLWLGMPKAIRNTCFLMAMTHRLRIPFLGGCKHLWKPLTMKNRPCFIQWRRSWFVKLSFCHNMLVSCGSWIYKCYQLAGITFPVGKRNKSVFISKDSFFVVFVCLVVLGDNRIGYCLFGCFGW